MNSKIKSAWRIYRFLGLLGLVTATWYDARSRWARIIGQRYIKKRIHNYQMFLDVNDPGISRSLLLFGTREVDHIRIFKSLLTPGMTVLDIGANIGYYVLMEAAAIGNGKVVAVEPVPSNTDLLTRNVALNRFTNVEVIQGAVSGVNGNSSLSLATRSNLHTFHPKGSAQALMSGTTIPVTTWTIGTLMEGRGMPDLIRMDVEGHEVEILNGMLDDVEAGRLAPLILFETHLSRYSQGHDMEAPLLRLFELGYRVRYLASSSEQGTAIINSRGYRASQEFPTDFVRRALYEYIADDVAIELICHTGGVRTVLLEKSNVHH